MAGFLVTAGFIGDDCYHGELIELMRQGGNLEVEVPSPIARVWHTLALEYSRCCQYFPFDIDLYDKSIFERD